MSFGYLSLGFGSFPSRFSPAIFGPRGLAMGGTGSGGKVNIIEFITIATTGNATDFGDCLAVNEEGAAATNGARGVNAVGRDSGLSNVLEFVTIATTGNATDFGNRTVELKEIASCQGEGRGLFAGGPNDDGSGGDTIDFIDIATTGNASDFGNLITETQGCAGTNSSVGRGVFGGGMVPGSDPRTAKIDFITIATTGNASDFGNITSRRNGLAACTDGSRGVFFGGHNAAGNEQDTIDFITIANTGNASDFGDIASGIVVACSATSDGTRGILMGGSNAGTTAFYNNISLITIANTSNSSDFGNLSAGRLALSATSGG